MVSKKVDSTSSDLVGVDEVGRGCWAGPVVAAAVVLDTRIEGLADSKKLSKQRRRMLALAIREQARSIGVGWVPANEVDSVGLTEAVRRAMARAVVQIDVPYSEVLIDGNYNYLKGSKKLVDSSIQVNTKIGADASVSEVSAASIIAKVARDTYMETVAHQCFPLYHFNRHVGYGTQLHNTLMKQFGICDIHRRSVRPVRDSLGE